jgi:glycogen synthase
MRNAMAQDFSWSRQIVKYDALYREMLAAAQAR